MAVAFQLHALIEILLIFLQPLLRTQYTVPHIIFCPGPTLLRMLFPLVMEVETDLRVDADAEVIANNAFLEKALSESRKINIRKSFISEDAKIYFFLN